MNITTPSPQQVQPILKSMLTCQGMGSGRCPAGSTGSARESSDALCTLCSASRPSAPAESVEQDAPALQALFHWAVFKGY